MHMTQCLTGAPRPIKAPSRRAADRGARWHTSRFEVRTFYRSNGQHDAA